LKLDVVDGSLPDYLASDLGGRLCSDKMRHVLESAARSADVLQWLPTQVALGDEVTTFWLLHFPEPVEALGQQTIWQGDYVVKPVLSRARLEGHAVLTYPGDEGEALIVNEDARDALERASCAGFELAETATEP
jgi:hypothetical protein